MTRSTAPQSNLSLVHARADDRGQAAPHSSQLQTLLYGLSLVTALPPDAILAPPRAATPEIRAATHPVLQALRLQPVLDRPTIRVGHGSVALEQVDWRMGGMIGSLDMSRTLDDGAMLICL